MTAAPGGTVGKFQIIEGYLPISPSKCMACGSFHGTFVDFGLNDDWYGAVYFCSACVTDMADQLGFHSPAQWAHMETAFKKQEQEINFLNEQLKRYKDAVDALGSVGIYAMHSNSDSSSTLEVISDQREEQLAIDSKPSGNKQRSSKQDDVKGSASVRNDDSLDEFLDTI